MGCYQAKQIKRHIERESSNISDKAFRIEEKLKNEILLLRSCLFEVLDMKEYQKSLISIQQDICLIKMKKRHEENIEDIIRCYEQNVLQRAKQIAAIIKQQKEINSETSLVIEQKGESPNENTNQNRGHILKNIKSLNTNCNSLNESKIFHNVQHYDVFQVLRYCESLNFEENQNYSLNVEPIQIDCGDEQEEVVEFKLN
ncbi:hypothetical protein TTHERM_00113150 (macronuclear) [Tetrahymena thermophila SB210]|uniref:Uncharacterized protein n=1 Tax=Tetrahymena thermophila (strain SB210) TaxID=312017 RepID=Q22Z56_TETTS|nr:hypothetical protein TTHERM_00113150 [Tetrahymena thermophila SB210]EAR90465.1 hypothetical protein TTHERM_00113150 [Tetrahymena thermophila SB210]|eukprot:XP_001010710.1 hypothetical protein TTHERM_00113150 [Tetrahymena thermophila SB210]